MKKGDDKNTVWIKDTGSRFPTGVEASEIAEKRAKEDIILESGRNNEPSSSTQESKANV